MNLMCEALGVSRSGFYAWLTRPRSTRSLADEALCAKVYQSFVGSDRTYGTRRVWHDILELGYRIVLNGSCASRHCVHAPDVAACQSIAVSALQ
jgi:putative transposase